MLALVLTTLTTSTALATPASAPGHPGAVSSASARPTLAVLDLEDRGAGKESAQSLTEVVTSSLAGLGVFDVLSRADIEQMVRFEQDRQLLGCNSDASCIAELGGALGVGLLVTGSIGKVGERFLLTLTLTDAQQGRVRAREQREIASVDELARETDKAARAVVRELLEGRTGSLVLKCSESGAEVELDGKLVGTTPYARQTVAAGPHRLRVSKRGFITWSRDVEVSMTEPLVVDVSLVPSLELIADYDASAGRWRTLAYVSGGLGAAALGSALYAYFVYNANRADEYDRDVTAAGCAADAQAAPTIDCEARFGDERDSIRTLDTLSTVGMLVGAAALGAGWYFYREGPEPGRYDPYKPSEGLSVSMSVAPTSGGFFAGATLRYE